MKTTHLSTPLLALAACLAACSSPAQQTGFDADDPSARTRALRQAVASNDRSKIPDIIEMLDSPDPAHRLLAIGALERMTDQTFDYDYAAPEYERDQAIRRWIEWWQANRPS